ncbi:16S rRNA (guanine(966)-N(2))-methyltransferase RsmD [[Eubacterium] yurii]|jgi:RNA methyltransferase, rsmD family|nr:16S rRNA (guanine(966)-N(2))-methyltransferase RsmD [[Eubacterium] yurii]
MRVIGGKYRGKKLIPPKNDDIRPTTDKARESLFNMLQYYIYESSFLDLFSGSAAVSIEAISRGAKHVTLVEKSRESIKTINANLNLIADEKSKAELISNDVINFLQTTKAKFDIIFSDPPYYYEKTNQIIDIIAARKLLEDDGIMIIETDKNENLIIPSDMYIDKEKIYSISKFSIIKNKEK